MVRVEGKDGEAIGQKAIEPIKIKEGATVEEQVWEHLKTVFDPEIPINVVELGLIYECKISPLDNGEHTIAIKMTLTAPGCGMGQVIADDVKRRLETIKKVKEVNVELTFDPPWDRSMMSDAAKLQLGLL